jgi:hypothetical protein
MLLRGVKSGNRSSGGLVGLALIPLYALQGASAAPAILHGPKIDAITYSTARVTWVTDKPSSTRIRYGLSPVYTGELTGPEQVTIHSWFISGLAPATTYHYQVCSADSAGETCSGNHVFVTGHPPALREPIPPQVTVNTGMPEGSYGDPFLVDPECSNLPAILRQLAALEGELNYEVRIPARTVCRGQFAFPKRPNHRGWIVVTSSQSSALPQPGTRVTAEDAAWMPVFLTDALPARWLHTRFLPQSCSPGHLLWGVNLPGMALMECTGTEGQAEPRTIEAVSPAGGGNLIITAPNHGLSTGDVVRLTGTGSALDGIAVIAQVVDGSRFLIPMLGVTEIQAGAVTKVLNWKQARHSRGAAPGASCQPNEFFFREDGTPPQEALSWCTSANQWTPVRIINTADGLFYAAITFEPGASRYRFTGVEVTHLPVPDPPPLTWRQRDYRQGLVGSLITLWSTNAYIIFDRCDIHGRDYPARLHTAVTLDGAHVAIVDSRIHKVNVWTEAADGVNLEAFAIQVPSGPGPGKIENNLIEAIGISLFFPEGPNGFLQAPPSDYEIRRNHFSHPDTYLYGSSQNVSGKNYMNRHLLELKRGRRIAIEGNLFDGNWADVVQGAMILITPRPGTSPVRNIVRIHNGTVSIAGSPLDLRPGMIVYLKDTGAANHDGLWEIVSVTDGTTIVLADAPSGTGTTGTLQVVASEVQIADIDIRNNIVRNGPHVLWITGHHDATGGFLNTKATQRVRFENNLIYGMDARSAAAGGRASPIGANRNGRVGIGVFAVKGIEDLLIRHNTFFDFRGNGTAFFFTDPDFGALNAGLDARFNIFTADSPAPSRVSAGKFGAEGLNETWTAHPRPEWTFAGNVFCCNPSGAMRQGTPDNNTWVNTDDLIGFENPGQKSFRLMESSPFRGVRMCASQPSLCPAGGRDLGANLDEIEAAIAGRSSRTRRPDLRDRRGGGVPPR